MKNILKWFSVLALSASTALAAEPLLLQWGTIDTSGSDAQAESAALKAKVAKKAALARARKSAAAEERAAYVVQFPGPVTDEWRTWLESSTQVRGYLPEFAYLVWATATEMETISANPDVFWTGEWKKDYKTVLAGTADDSAATKSAAAATADPARWMHVGSLLVGDDGAADLRARIEALDTTVRSAFPRLDGCGAVAYLTDAQIDEISAWPDVQWIEPKLQPRLFNDQAARTNMMNVSNVWKSLSSGGLGLTGSGQIVAVADTGCDKGSTSDIHADFAGRVVAGYGWTNGAYKSSASWADLDAHGTHVAGSVLGSGAKSSGQFKGMAYEAQLVMQGCWEDLGGLPDDVQDLFKQAYNAGARIHSDSWGFGTNYAGRYVYDAVDADGYMWTNQNFLALFAAGNDGIDKNSDGIIDAGSVTPPSTAKNCICVGAAENWRANGGYSRSKWGSAWPSDYPADPIKTDYISETDTPQGLAAFSSRGPTQDGRFKPDIVAPGTDIISVRSRAASDTGWGLYSANTNYIYEGGTSMATPLTSGATALVRQWLVDRKGISEPPAALMKALLINGARDMTPGQYDTAHQEITARPDRSQGFGHVNLYNSLEPGDGNFLVFATNKLTSSANFTTNINVGQANAGKYILTLVWQDYPGSSGGSKNLVNDLDLTVTSPSGTVYYPNNLSGLDHTNNVEFIEFTAAETGTYSVKVNGYSVSKTSPHGGQPFALVMRGPETATDPVPPAFSSATSATNGVQFEYIEFTFSSLLTAGYPTPTYNLTTAVSTNEYGFEQSNGYLLFTPQSYGTFTFKCVASNENGTATNTLTVTVTQAPPAVPANLALSDIDVSSFTASWSAAANADSYSLDVATVSGSAGPSTLISETFSSSMGWTSAGTSYTSGSHENANGTWTYGNAIFHPSDAASSPGSAGNIQLQKAAYLYFPPVDNPSSVSINAKGSSTGTMILEQQIDGDWTTIASESISGTVAHYEASVSGAGAATAFRVHSGDRALYLYDVTVSGASASYTSLSGYPKDVSSLSASVTGLSPATDYAARVRGVNGAGASDWSDWATATTLAGVSAPAWTAFPAQTYRFGSGDGYFNFNVSSYVSGSPAPALSLEDTPLEAVLTEETGEFTFEPDALGTFSFTFVASNSLGVASNTLSVTVDAVAPVLAAIGDRTGTLGSDVEFPLSATGDPAPVFDVTSTDAADAVVVDQAGTSYFLFTPAATGTYHFTVTASNIAGSDSESFTVTINDAPVTVPSLTVSDVTDTSALASWTACDGVTTYTLQLASDDQFTSGGSGATVTLFSNDGTDATVPTGWSYEIESAGNKSGLVLKNDDYVITESFDASSCTALSLSLEIRTYGGSSGTTDTLLVQYSADNGTSWNNVGTITATGKTLAAADPLDVSVAAGNASVRLRFTDPGASSSQGVGIAYLVLTGTESAAGGSLISTDTVNGLSHAFTGLDPVTTYYARVKGDSDWSSVVSFTTQSTGDSAPVWTAIPSQTVDVGTNCWLNLADYVSGTPAPAITLVSTTADSGDYEFEDGYLMFAPPAAGSYTFTFMASNSVGTANATLTVTGHAEAPVLTASLGTALSSTVGENVEFTVTAAGIPAPATIDASCTEGAYFIFENGEFLFDSPAVGTYHFVFTATNVAGSDTLTVTVTVSDAPVTVPELTVSDITDTTALATWTACDGVSSYTLQLSTNDFAAATSSSATRDVTTLLTEHFTNAIGFSTAAISDFDNIADNDGWEGSYVYVHDGSVRISSSKNTGDIESPWLTNATAGATVTLAFGSVSWTNASTIVNVTVTEDGSTYSAPGSFALTEAMTTYTTNFPVYGTRFRVRWAPSAANKRFFLDDVVITSASSGGDDVETFTVAGTSHTFTNLTPETTYYARVKGEADWSNVEPFTTLATTVPPSWSADFPASWSMTAGDIDGFAVADYLSGNPAPTVTLTTDAPSGDYLFENGDFTYNPTSTGTFTFAFTASNTAGTADATLTVTVTGSAPAWSALPAQTIAVGEDCELYLTSYVSGTPTPAISLTTGGDIADFDPAEDNYFYFTTPTAGTYTFVFTASNVLGTATADLTVTVTGGDTPVSDYEQWLIDNGYPEEPEGTIADNGHTYWENYIADIDPTSTNELELVPNPTTGSTFTVPAASENRYYQLIYSTDLTGDFAITNLGWGATGASGISFPADWYGSIRVLLDEPADP